MAYGTELFLGLMGRQAVELTAQALGLSFAPYEGLSEHEALHKKLEQAQIAAFSELGLRVLGHDARGYLKVQGLDGDVRPTCVWDVEVDFDPDEMGHAEKDMLIGVSLISRYYPVYLDWQSENGGSGETIVLSPQVLLNIEIARRHLTPILPFIAGAPITIRERHY